MLGLRALQHDVLEGVARDLPAQLVMNRLCLQAERLAPDVACTILAVDCEGRLHPLAAPSLPSSYSLAIAGMQSGPQRGSCGTAAYFGEAVEVVDIATDPLWTDFKNLALPLGLRACWSSPICASDGRVIGTFAFYFRTCRGPSALERTIVQACVNLCAIALEQKDRKEKIQRLAYFDALTGVANRSAFEQYAREALAVAAKSRGGVAILWIDLDNFKSVNDTLGHQAGDELLKIVAERLGDALKSGEFLARMGGDEFVVLQASAANDTAIQELARRVGAAVSQPVALHGTKAAVGASIGVARAPADGFDLTQLMKKADLALYEAKANNSGSFSFFSREIEARMASRWQAERELEHALERREFELYFQPIVNLAAPEVSGFEALLRWRRAEHGVLTPPHFLPIAEKAGLICDIGDWALGEACRLGASLPPHIRVAVNLSPTQLFKPGFALDVARALAATNFPPSRLELEITESVLLLENAATHACLSDLRRLGVSIALDDFGTGFSALSHLRAFPVDRIKIDRSFVQEIDIRRETASIIRAIVGLARELGVKTTAEGVETPAQLRKLHGFGCDEIQGYLISQPKPLSAFRQVVEGPRARPLAAGRRG
ncbi:EAL domain-containing protein [Methylocystis parvus]|uniref:EAL domain-containing protein n=2 Tax=Methylocystis parvus TaxID=134 RepID=A0A6B8MED3_9HYPH|nr:EAL domain-containing protein [Methylocystis parvus]